MTKKDEREAVIDPALREDMSASPRRHFESSPPPVPPVPNSHSPSPSAASVDRSSNSTPHIRRASPPMPSYPYYDRYRQDHHHHHSSGYLYAPPPPFDPRYDHHPHPHYQHHLPPPDASGHHYSPAGLPTHYIPGPMPHPQGPPPPAPPSAPYGHHYVPIPAPPPAQVVFTSDANTKLTDGIRRRCFNCCSFDTSTWRRSNLSPGKVLCNKCGLFERTHSRPRPEQFPHKRGSLASSNLRGRTPPAGSAQPPQLPSLAAATGPYQYHHTSLTPLNATGDYPHHMHHPLHQQQPQQPHPHANTLPGLQSWHGNTSMSSASSGGNGGGTASPTNGPASNIGSNSNGPTDQSQLLNRRSGPSSLDSPRMPSGGSTPVSAGRLQFDDRLSSSTPVGVDPHLRSRPSSPPLSVSRSSTNSGHPPESHTPPRDPQA